MKVILDEKNPDTYVISMINGKKYTRITHTHTKKYGMSVDEYCQTYNVSRQDIICKLLRGKLSWTKKSCIKMYGDIEGTKRWNEYRQKQAISNTYEYKKQKHGWTKEQFRKYNLSRASTRDNFIKRYGKNTGERKWNEYCKLQSYAGSSKEYYQEMYGDIKGLEMWDDLCRRKSNTLSTFIDRYGAEEGTKRFQSYNDNRFTFHSGISQELFIELSKTAPILDNIYYATKDGEYSVYDSENNIIYFYDYVDYTTKKCIEFNGDIFHGNPAIYKSMDCPNPYNKKLKCLDIWNYDKLKIECINRERKIDVLVVWESDYRKDPDRVVAECIKFLKYE